jgi:pentatricopeptide repeat protein
MPVYLSMGVKQGFTCALRSEAARFVSYLENQRQAVMDTNIYNVLVNVYVEANDKRGAFAVLTKMTSKAIEVCVFGLPYKMALAD